MPPDRSERRRRSADARRRRRTLVLVVAGVLAAVGGAVAFTAGGSPSHPAAARLLAPPRLHPPGPFPGYLLIADRGNNRMLLVDGAHHIFWRYPGGGKKAMPFVFDDDTFFGPHHDRIVSNQEDQDTIQVISFPGRHLLWRYGHVNVKSGAPGYLNTPDDAYLLPSHLITVADAYNCRVLFISPAHRVVKQFGTTGVCRHDPPRYLGAVNGATPLPDGGTLVSEIAGSWIDDIGPSGKLRWAVQAPVAYPSDPQLLAPNRILLADYSRPGAAIIMTRAGKVVWRYRPTSGSGALDHPSLATLIAPGLVAINDDYRDRVVVVSIRTRTIVWQYGHTDHPGTADGYLNTPDGLDLLKTADAQASPVVRRFLLSRRRPARVQTAVPKPLGGLRVTIPYHLPAPVEREVAVTRNGAVLIAGGLDAGGTSTAGVFSMNAATGKLTSLGSMPQPFHDAAGAVIGQGLFVFGGGAAQSSSSVQRFDLATHAARIVSHLPRPLSDIASAAAGQEVYLVGGYDGRVPRAEIYRTTDGMHFAVVARLPVGLRYPAVAVIGNRLVIAGGTAATGASRRVFVLGLRSHVLQEIGRLPAPIAHAEAFAAGSRVYVAGGVDAAGAVTGAVTAVDPATGRVARVAGSLAVSDAATVAVPGGALVLGGASAAGPTGAVRRVAVAHG